MRPQSRPDDRDPARVWPSGEATRSRPGRGQAPPGRARLQQVEPQIGRWLRHPIRDDYWREDGPLDDSRRIACPALIVAGWADPGFAAAALRLVVGLEVPRTGFDDESTSTWTCTRTLALGA